MQYLNLANAITSFRIIGALCLCFTTSFSKVFYIIYTLSGLSDAFDGYVARKTRTSSAFGAKLDSIADLIFYGVMVVKISPALLDRLPRAFWIAVTAVVLVKLCSYIVTAVKYRRFEPLHTKLNKITGFAVFMIAYMIRFPVVTHYCVIACGISVIASFEDMLIHIKNDKYAWKEK